MRVRHAKYVDRDRTLCGHRPPSVPAADGAAFCKRCVDRAARAGIPVKRTPERTDLTGVAMPADAKFSLVMQSITAQRIGVTPRAEVEAA